MLITQRQLSLAIVGPQNSGKTTLTNIIAGETFEKDTIPTLGVHIRDIKAPHHTNIRIYDLAGQTRFHKLALGKVFPAGGPYCIRARSIRSHQLGGVEG